MRARSRARPTLPSPARYSGFENGDGPGVLGGTLTFTTPANASSPAGNYAIAPGGLSASNYAITYVPGTLSVIPAPTPPHVTNIVRGGHTRKGLTAITVSFNEALNGNSAISRVLYELLGGVKKRRQLVYTKALAIKTISYSESTNNVKITLAKPYNGKVLVTVHGGVLATNGATSNGDYSKVVS